METKSSKDFNCAFLKNASLENCPEEIDGHFDCSHNSFTSLKGSPKKVGKNFHCSFNKLTSLRYAPEYVGGSFYCDSNKLASLRYAPKYVGGKFDCSRNNITSLKGCPRKVTDFACNGTKITSLEGCPEEVSEWFDCSYTNINSLEGCPKEVAVFNCSFTNITSLRYAPKCETLYCSGTKITEKEIKRYLKTGKCKEVIKDKERFNPPSAVEITYKFDNLKEKKELIRIISSEVFNFFTNVSFNIEEDKILISVRAEEYMKQLLEARERLQNHEDDYLKDFLSEVTENLSFASNCNVKFV